MSATATPSPYTVEAWVRLLKRVIAKGSTVPELRELGGDAKALYERLQPFRPPEMQEEGGGRGVYRRRGE